MCLLRMDVRVILPRNRVHSMRLLSRFFAATLLISATASAAKSSSPEEEDALLRDATVAIERARMDLIGVRRDLHTFPERSGAESRTAAIVAARLRARGLEVRTGVGGHGVVGILRGDRPGPVIAFRADMDAVPSTAPDPVDFRSQVPGLRHICGHDIHTTVGLAIADGLSAIADRLPGTVVFLFQPAEESATGAQLMLADGVFDVVRPREIFAFHTASLAAGRVGTKPGAMLPARDHVSVSFRAPANRNDLAQQVATYLAALASPGIGSSSAEPFVILQSQQAEWLSGSGQWRVSATLTVSGPEAREAARTRLEAALGGLRQAGFSPFVDWQRRVPGAFNDPTVELSLRPAIERAMGAGNLIVSSTLPTPFSEDFGWFTDEIPGVMYWLGVANAERGWSGVPHSPDYVADEDSIQAGARAMTAVILHRLRH